MDTRLPEVAEVFSAREIARAAGASRADAEALLASGVVTTRDGEFAEAAEAVRAVLLLNGRHVGPGPAPQLFRPLRNQQKRRGIPLTTSGMLHVAAFGIALVMTLGVTDRATERAAPNPTRLVFLVKPGPGGGGGGGGLKQPAPPRPAMLQRVTPPKLKSPVPVERAVRRPVPDPPRPKPVPPPEVKPVERPIEPPPPVAKPDPVPPVVAPVASAPADTKDQAGVLAEAPPSNSQGSGTGGGSGTGRGSGIGEGSGPGIGDGSGGGTGGGPYRPGSGITPPELLREVRPSYTEEARRRAVSGEVVLEIVVRSDGRVGEMKVLRGLGSGLDQRAVDAVRQWQFSPARRHGTPVDVLVEVAVEFKLR
jgi:TonB family protein